MDDVDIDETNESEKLQNLMIKLRMERRMTGQGHVDPNYDDKDDDDEEGDDDGEDEVGDEENDDWAGRGRVDPRPVITILPCCLSPVSALATIPFHCIVLHRIVSYFIASYHIALHIVQYAYRAYCICVISNCIRNCSYYIRPAAFLPSLLLPPCYTTQLCIIVHDISCLSLPYHTIQNIPLVVWVASGGVAGCICVFVYLFICVFVYLCICVFVYLCICICIT